MTEEIEFETYIRITSKIIGIYVFDKTKLQNLYFDEINYEIEKDNIDFEILTKIIEGNVFKIEKLIGKFIENIFLILESEENFQANICIKKKIYNKQINKKILENVLTEVKDLFKEAYHDQVIMHMIINNYLINGKNYHSYVDNLRSDKLCLEVNFMSISSNTVFALDKILEKYQIKIKQYLNAKYIENFAKVENIEIPEMACKLKNGYNDNEVILVPKNTENKGFFEKFFQLFS